MDKILLSTRTSLSEKCVINKGVALFPGSTLLGWRPGVSFPGSTPLLGWRPGVSFPGSTPLLGWRPGVSFPGSTPLGWRPGVSFPGSTPLLGRSANQVYTAKLKIIVCKINTCYHGA